jgi:hypothetical protein
MINLEEIKEIRAYTSGIVEMGSVTIIINNREWQFDIEEWAVHGNLEFRVYLARWQDSKDLALELEEGRVVDNHFCRFIQDEYYRITAK